MNIETIIRSLEMAQKEKFVKFITDKGKNSCADCLQYHGKIFKSDAADKPELPIHPNCRCKYEEIENPQIEKIKARFLQMVDQLKEFARHFTSKATELLSEAEKLIQETQKTKGKIEASLLAAKISVLIIAVQCVLWSIIKINIAIAELQKAAQQLGMKIADFGEEALSLAKAPAELTSALKQLHHSRLLDHDQQQRNLPTSPEEAIKRGFVKAPDSQNRYHRNKGQAGNNKYYHPVTGQEVVFDKNGKIVTDHENTGTKNYGPKPVSKDHILYDILPYWIWGNSENDTTPIWDRIFGIGK